MCHRSGLEVVDLLRDITDTDLPFGGKPFLVGGDFAQLLPVVVRGSVDDCIRTSLKRSYLWTSFKIFRLSRNMRYSDGPQVNIANNKIPPLDPLYPTKHSFASIDAHRKHRVRNFSTRSISIRVLDHESVYFVPDKL